MKFQSSVIGLDAGELDHIGILVCRSRTAVDCREMPVDGKKHPLVIVCIIGRGCYLACLRIVRDYSERGVRVPARSQQTCPAEPQEYTSIVSIKCHQVLGRHYQVTLYARPLLLVLRDLDHHIVDAGYTNVVDIADIAAHVIVVHGLFVVGIVTGFSQMDDVSYFTTDIVWFISSVRSRTLIGEFTGYLDKCSIPRRIYEITPVNGGLAFLVFISLIPFPRLAHGIERRIISFVLRRYLLLGYRPVFPEVECECTSHPASAELLVKSLVIIVLIHT